MNPFQPLKNASDTLLSERPGTVPDVSGGILNWFRPLVFSLVTKSVVNMQLVEETVSIQTVGFLTPGKQTLKMMPEGQRLWKPWMLFAVPNLVLKMDDIITIENLRQGDTSYRVLGKSDFSEMGYVSYDLEEDYS